MINKLLPLVAPSQIFQWFHSRAFPEGIICLYNCKLSADSVLSETNMFGNLS